MHEKKYSTNDRKSRSEKEGEKEKERETDKPKTKQESGGGSLRPAAHPKTGDRGPVTSDAQNLAPGAPHKPPYKSGRHDTQTTATTVTGFVCQIFVVFFFFCC
jgi:hypothetical protein